MKIAREGIPFAAAALLLAGICWAGVRVGIGLDPSGASTPGAIALGIAAWVFSIASVFVLWFFRNPEPAIPSDGDLVVAPVGSALQGRRVGRGRCVG